MRRDPNDPEPETPAPEGALPSATDVRGFKMSRTGTALGLGRPDAPAERGAATTPKARTLDVPIEEVLRGFDAQKGDVPKIVTASSDGHRAAAYHGAHTVRSGQDTLPPERNVMVDVPTEPIAPPPVALPDGENDSLDEILDGFSEKFAERSVSVPASFARGRILDVDTEPPAGRAAPFPTAPRSSRLRVVVIAICGVALVIVLAAFGRWATTVKDETPARSATAPTSADSSPALIATPAPSALDVVASPSTSADVRPPVQRAPLPPAVTTASAHPAPAPSPPAVAVPTARASAPADRGLFRNDLKE